MSDTRKAHTVYLISIVVAASLWLSDSFFSYLWFNPQMDGFLSYLIPLAHPRDLLLRFFYTSMIILSGWVVSRIFLKMVRGERETRRLRNYLQNIVNSMPSMLIGLSPEGSITLWNTEAEDITGISAAEAMGKDLSKVFPEIGDSQRFIDAIRQKSPIVENKKPFKTEEGRAYRNMTLFPLVANGVEGGVLRITDVTEQVKLEELMVQSEKMLSVGGLAAGMAHEINNPLAGIMQTAGVMESRLSQSPALQANIRAAEEAGTTLEAVETYMKKRGILRMVENIHQSGSRLADIVDNMLSFARKQGDRKSTHNLAEIIDRTIDLACTDYDLKKQYDFKRINIVREYEPDVPPVPCEVGKIQQVILNILRNGAEAMQEAGTAVPRFTVRSFTGLDEDCACSSIQIENNGPTIPEEICKRIFEPFYTTKPVGQGTGLGMSVSYFIIVNDHGGKITVESGPESGVYFTISLPVEGKMAEI